MKFSSKVNNVYADTHTRYGSVVVKEYGKTAIETGVSVPLERAIIEYRLYKWLEVFLKDNKYVKVPKVIEFNYSSTPILITQKIEMPPLVSGIENVRNGTLIEILKLLERIESLEKTYFSHIFEGLWDVQEQCRDALIQYKFGKGIKKEIVPSILCLGDVSAANILAKEEKAYLIDFEFAHWGYKGYDIGQFASHSGIGNCDSYWAKKFKLYYD